MVLLSFHIGFYLIKVDKRWFSFSNTINIIKKSSWCMWRSLTTIHHMTRPRRKRLAILFPLVPLECTTERWLKYNDLFSLSSPFQSINVLFYIYIYIYIYILIWSPLFLLFFILFFIDFIFDFTPHHLVSFNYYIKSSSCFFYIIICLFLIIFLIEFFFWFWGCLRQW